MAMQPMQPMPPAFVTMPTAEAYASMQHPEMMQGMQAIPMQMVMGPMGPMMAAAPMGPGMAAMVPGGAMAAPHLTQMLVEAARGGRSSNVFFKTRICNKWRAGSCPYGDKCTYAHGEHELRYVPPEIVAQLEQQQKMQETAQQRQGGGGGAGPDGPQPRGEEGGGPQGAAFAGPNGGNANGGHQSFYKTRLCIKYMQTGFCHKAGACTFAHGYEDLRQPGAPLSPGRMPQDSMSPGMSPSRMAGMMMPAGMMGMALQPGRGMPMAAAGGMPMTMPMAVPAMAPHGRYPGQQQQHMQRSPHGYGGGGPREDPAAAARRRAAAMCQIAGVGEVGTEEPHPAAMQAALSDVRSGAAYRDSAYADSVADLVQGQGQQRQGQEEGDS